MALHSMKAIMDLIKVSRGDRPADILLKDARIVNVLTGTIERNSVALFNGKIAGIGDYKAKRTINLKGLFLSPGLIDSHIHLESAMLSPSEFVKAVLPRGTTSVIIDPHEIANVLGAKGIRYILNSTKKLPLNFYVMLPSCVPATEMETSGARLSAKDLRPFLKSEWVIGLAEVMNYPGVISGNKDLLKKIQMMKKMRIDGHAPLLSGKPLNAYIAAGISSDHESTIRNEAEEKLKKGMFIMIREGTTEKNMDAVLPLVKKENSRRFALVSDDRHPLDLLHEGHLDSILRKAVLKGLDPIIAIQLVTMNPAEHFGLKGLGAIAPGYKADLVVFEDLKDFRVSMVFKDGKLVADNGRVLSYSFQQKRQRLSYFMNVNWKKLQGLQVKAKPESLLKVIEVFPAQITTRKIMQRAKIRDGFVISNPQKDILKAVAIERHKGTGNVGIGFVKGFGLKKGAIGSSFAHDSHNMVIVGVDDKDIMHAARKITEMKGGLVITSHGKVLASLPLPIAGLMSDESLKDVARANKKLLQNAKMLGCTLPDPFMTLSFLALPVIPELRLTDKGLIDVERFKVISIFA